MNYKLVAFVAKIEHNDSTANVACQTEILIHEHSAGGWEYLRLENVETQVAVDNGCFGLGAKPDLYGSFPFVKCTQCN